MRNIVICADLEKSSLENLKKLRNDILDISNVKVNVHLIHVFEVHLYNAELVSILYPSETQYSEIEVSTLSILSNLASSLGLSSEQFTAKCFFSHSREEKILSYLNLVEADLVIVATRGKHGIPSLFTNSLTGFLYKHSPCDVLVIRPKNTT
jgi:nucleotide-binding universal stress UspA family protein